MSELRWKESLTLLALLTPAGMAWGQQPFTEEPFDESLGVTEERAPPGGEGIDQTPVYYLSIEGGEPVLQQSPWRSVANPPNVDPGDASLRDEPVYEPGVVVLTF